MGAFTQQQKPVAKNQGGSCTRERCVQGSMNAGWTSSEASSWCGRP
jgi:hypothetical protein